MPATDGGLGEHIVGDKVVVGKRNIVINSLLDEGKTKLRDLLHPSLSIVLYLMALVLGLSLLNI